ncbi:MAG TPA: hypothetical protein VL175_06700 [Pirellulales bacterium]|jgi:hypothetical protein|nr:hypothetical protein [Pirellulales bacterium]
MQIREQTKNRAIGTTYHRQLNSRARVFWAGGLPYWRDVKTMLRRESTMAGLTTAEIEKINEELEALRRKLRDNGATALNPTVEWSVLRKEVGVLNKKLNADMAAKKLAAKAAD